MSPYNGLNEELFKDTTLKLISDHPLEKEDIIEAVLTSWNEIFNSRIGDLSYGKDIFPTPQMLSNFLHELVPHFLSKQYPTKYRVGMSKDEKDIVYEPDRRFSVEVKASSSRNDIYANRSYAQPASDNSKKSKNGYYIAINFEKFRKEDDNYIKSQYLEGVLQYPLITKIKFGYLDHTDWKPQKAATGQQASLTRLAKKVKLIQIYPDTQKS